MTSELPLVSVLMPVYNAAEYLPESIKSILKQTYQNYEFIIIDDGSTDKSLKIINSFAEKNNNIKVISQDNRGMVASLNTGIDHAKGKYIARMDADDISLPDRLFRQVEVLITKDNIDVVGCDFDQIDENGNIIGQSHVPKTPEDIFFNLFYNVPFAHPSLMIRKKIFDQYRYEESETEDYHLFVRIFDHNIYNLAFTLFQYRHQYGASYSDTKRMSMMKSQAIISKEFCEKNIEEFMRYACKQVNPTIYFSRALATIYIRYDRKRVLSFLINNIKFIPGFLEYYIRHGLRILYWSIRNVM